VDDDDGGSVGTGGRARTARKKIEMRKETRARRMPKACVGDKRFLKALDR